MNQKEGPARYIMIGGFLGAGKSTSIVQLAHYLDAKGLKVGLITNDQGHRLVDTMNVRAHGFPVEEIPGGCFCCRFQSLMEAAENLTATTRPDVFIAEPVGSCTDLVASVSYPLRRIYGDQFTVAPLSVVLDPRRAMRVLGIGDGAAFSAKVTYIYLKQIEEAATIVINKADLLDQEQQNRLLAELRQRFPDKEIIVCSARQRTGLEPWFESIINNQQPGGNTMALDYDIYAEGEALLGWLNATVTLAAGKMIDGDALLADLAQRVQTYLGQEAIEIAHFKMTLEPNDDSSEIAVLSLVGSEYLPEFTQQLSDFLERGEIIVNLRAEGAPETLRTALTETLARMNDCSRDIVLEMEHVECFRPGKPEPIYRMANEHEKLVLAR